MPADVFQVTNMTQILTKQSDGAQFLLQLPARCTVHAPVAASRRLETPAFARAMPTPDALPTETAVAHRAACPRQCSPPISIREHTVPQKMVKRAQIAK